MAITRVLIPTISNTYQLQQQLNTALDNVYDAIDADGGGTVTKVATGTGLTGGPITTTGTISMADTAVTAGKYTAPDLTIDKQGRITAAASNTLNGGTVTKVDTGAGLTGGPVTTTGTIALDPSGITTSVVAVGSLPAAGTAGRRLMVNDANATTFASIVAAGGTNVVPVYDDGTNWRIG